MEEPVINVETIKSEYQLVLDEVQAYITSLKKRGLADGQTKANRKDLDSLNKAIQRLPLYISGFNKAHRGLV